MSPATAEGNGRVVRFPRVSGDEPGVVHRLLNLLTFSPRERG